jgi:hypothetical protein
MTPQVAGFFYARSQHEVHVNPTYPVDLQVNLHEGNRPSELKNPVQFDIKGFPSCIRAT